MTNFRKLLFLSLALLLASCAKSPDTASDLSSSDEIVLPKIHYHIVVISGFESDPTAEQIAGTSPRRVGNSGMYQLMGDLKAKNFDCSFYNWNGTQAGNIRDKKAPKSKGIAADMLARLEDNPDTEFVLIGHSWGGHTLLEVAAELSENEKAIIKYATVVDPSSLMRGKRVEQLPVNIPILVNYYTGNAFCWGAWKDEERVENIELGDSANGFSVDGRPNYGSKFDTHAHTAAEWDEKIHADICKRVTEATK